MEQFEEQLRAYYQMMQLSNYKENPAFIRVRIGRIQQWIGFAGRTRTLPLLPLKGNYIGGSPRSFSLCCSTRSRFFTRWG